MFLPERYRRNPPQRRSTPAAAPPPADATADELPTDEPAEQFEEEQLSDEAFLKSLRAEMEGVRAGTLPSMTDAMRPALKDRPWGRRHKIRDKHGKVY